VIGPTGTQRFYVINNIARTAALGLAGTGAGVLMHEGCALRWIAVRLADDWGRYNG